VKLPETGAITSFLFARKSWQIFQDDNGTRVLVTTPELMDAWVRRKFIDPTCVRAIKNHGKILYNYFLSPARYCLSPVKNGDISQDYTTAYSFAMAISSSRSLDSRSDFTNGVFSSLHRKILPVPTTTGPRPHAAGQLKEMGEEAFRNPDEKALKAEGGKGASLNTARRNDETMLVNWLTKGAAKKVGAQPKLGHLVRWLSPEQLSRVLKSAGINAEGKLRNSRKGTPAQGKEAAGKEPREGSIFKPKEKSPPSKRSKEPRAPRPTRFSLPGRRELEAFFNEHIVEVVNEPERYRKMGIDNPSAVILHGPPGCGKTYAADQLVRFLDLPSFFVNSGTVASPYIHDSSKKISAIFDKAIAAAPSVLIVDEMEAYMGHRSSSSSQQHQVEEVAEFLRRIPEAIDKRVIIIAMTNLLDFIDTALLRQGRFDHKIKLDLPDRIDVKAALQSILAQRPTDPGLDIEPVVDKLVRRPLSDCNYVVREASRLVVRRKQEHLDQEVLLEAVKRLPSNKLKPDIGF
jgi:hypothetical protein